MPGGHIHYDMEPPGNAHRLQWHMKFHLVLSSLWRSTVGFITLCWCRYVNVTSSPYLGSRITVNLTQAHLVYPSGKHGNETVTDGSQL